MSEIVNKCCLVSDKIEDKNPVLKSSFDRIDDDLMEVILSYLPITDKIRLESTSKLIQSLIFNKQTYLRIHRYPSKDDPYNDLNIFNYFYDFNFVLENVLKKFKNLNKLSFDCDIINSEMIQTIAVNCGTKLKTLLIQGMVDWLDDPDDISDACLQILAQKCGQSLQSLRFDQLSDKQLRQLMSSTPELRSVFVDHIKSVVTEDNHKLLPKLREIVFCSCNEKTLNQFQNQYSDTILKINGQLSMEDPNALIRFLAGFGRFQKLQSLILSIGSCNFEMKSLFANQFRQLGDKLSQLKLLSIQCPYPISIVFPNENLLSFFSKFKSLSHLEININGYNKNEYPVPYNYGSIRDLRNLTQLKHLRINLEQLSDASLENIHIYLPQLVSISLESYTEHITDKSLRYLSKIKYLSRLRIRCNRGEDNNKITESGVKELIDSCPLLKFLAIHFDITEETIKLMILKSQRMPKIHFEYWISLSGEKRSQMSGIFNDLPTNLSFQFGQAKVISLS